MQIKTRNDGKTIFFKSGDYYYFINLVEAKDTKEQFVAINLNHFENGEYIKVNRVWFTVEQFNDLYEKLTSLKNQIKTFTPVSELQSQFKTTTRKIVEGS